MNIKVLWSVKHSSQQQLSYFFHSLFIQINNNAVSQNINSRISYWEILIYFPLFPILFGFLDQLYQLYQISPFILRSILSTPISSMFQNLPILCVANKIQFTNYVFFSLICDNVSIWCRE